MERRRRGSHTFPRISVLTQTSNETSPTTQLLSTSQRIYMKGVSKKKHTRFLSLSLPFVTICTIYSTQDVTSAFQCCLHCVDSSTLRLNHSSLYITQMPSSQWSAVCSSHFTLVTSCSFPSCPRWPHWPLIEGLYIGLWQDALYLPEAVHSYLTMFISNLLVSLSKGLYLL